MYKLNVIIKSEFSFLFLPFCLYAYGMYFCSIKTLSEPEMEQVEWYRLDHISHQSGKNTSKNPVRCQNGCSVHTEIK